ncbi:MAG: T9SS type A sorting domain-containing protein [Chitinophagales bacterium]|nr:T9SS type A sorting domain-containing protein [Chitinophagales bacterium]MDW8427145.1 GEVED domain-containing protein [Chitinophagales bacterium]
MTFWKFKCFLITTIVSVFGLLTKAQTVIIPANNANDSSDNRPFGCYWGYERTQILLLQSELGNTNYVTEVGFFVNAVNSPAASTPVVIRMKSSTATTLTSNTYAAAISGSTIVWSGNITASMLSANNWVSVPLTTAFYVGNANLEIFVETNYGAYGGEAVTAKQFRQSLGAAQCQFWYNDLSEPKDYGTVRNMRPNVRLKFEPACSGTPTAGTAVASVNPVCKDSLFVLSLSGVTNIGGLTFQWQSSSNGTNYTNISGATGATHTLSQTSAKFYRCQVTCSLSGQSATSAAVQVTMKPHYNCYCPSYAFSSQDSKIDSVKLGTLVSGSSSTQCETYTDYTSLPAPVLTPGVPQKLRVVNGSCSGQAFDVYLNVYIDYNQNADFGGGNELVYSGGPVSQLNGFGDITFVIPTTVASGLTRMRLVLSEQDPASYCGGYTRGETEDYLVQIAALTPCSSTPWSAGATVASPAAVCSGKSVVLSLDNYPTVSGLSYQWQFSYDNISWTSITGATSLIYTVASVTQNTYYRCRISCSGGQTQNSAPVLVPLQPFYYCYCASHALQPEDTKIDTVLLNNQVYASSPQKCEVYTPHAAPVDVYLNALNTIEIANGTCTGDWYPAWLSVYADFSKDGDFTDGGELIYSSGPISSANSIPVISFQPPAGTTTGLTGLRIILHEASGAPSPCAVNNYGETEDFVINLVTLPPCVEPPTAGTASASVVEACSFEFPLQNIQLTLTGNSSGIGQTYQWQQSFDGVVWTDIPGATATVHFVTVTQSTYYRCKVTCNNTTVTSNEVFVHMIPEPSGNTTANPIVVNSFPFSYSGTNQASHCYTDDYTGPNNQSAPDVFFLVPLTKTGTLKVSTCNGNDLNTYIHLLDADGNHLNSNDDNGPYCTGPLASDSLHHIGDATNYLVVVEGYDMSEGAFVLELAFSPDTVVGMSDESRAVYLSVFPNPNNGVFVLSGQVTAADQEPVGVIVTNSLGQAVVHTSVEGRAGFLHQLIQLPEGAGRGTYLITVHTASGLYRTLMMVVGN